MKKNRIILLFAVIAIGSHAMQQDTGITMPIYGPASQRQFLSLDVYMVINNAQNVKQKKVRRFFKTTTNSEIELLNKFSVPLRGKGTVFLNDFDKKIFDELPAFVQKTLEQYVKDY